MDFTAVGKTDRGVGRTNNEDEFYLDEKLGLLVVADGMGGHASGEITVNWRSMLFGTIFQDRRN